MIGRNRRLMNSISRVLEFTRLRQSAKSEAKFLASDLANEADKQSDLSVSSA